MLFTIAISIYNGTKELTRMIESILNQTNFSDFELLLINDGSTNCETVKICKSYEREGIKLYNKIDEGLCSARNKALEESNGKYILFLDQDDFLDDCIMKELELISEIDDFDIITFGYDVNFFDKKDSLKKSVRYQGKTRMLNNNCDVFDYFNLNVGGVVNPVWNKAYNITFLKKHKLCFDEKLKWSLDDFEFNLRAFSIANKVYIDETIGYHYVYSAVSSSRQYFPILFEQCLNIFDKWKISISNNSYDLKKYENQYYKYFYELSILRMFENICFSSNLYEDKKKQLETILNNKIVIYNIEKLHKPIIEYDIWRKIILKYCKEKNAKKIMAMFIVKKKINEIKLLMGW